MRMSSHRFKAHRATLYAAPKNRPLVAKTAPSAPKRELLRTFQTKLAADKD
jgi:hypothetical protein